MIQYTDDQTYISTQEEFTEFTKWSHQHPEFEEVFTILGALSSKIHDENPSKPYYVDLDILMNGLSDLLNLTHKNNE